MGNKGSYVFYIEGHKKMKILHITNAFREGGGVESYLLLLLPALKSSGHEVELLVLDKRKTKLVQVVENIGIKVYTGKYTYKRDPRNIFLIRTFLCKGKYNIVHAHLFPTQYFVAIANILNRQKTTIVTTEHGTYNKRRRYSFLKKVERFIYNQYVKIICISRGVKTSLDKWVSLPSKSSIIYNGVDISKFRKAKPYSKTDLGLPENTKIVTMIARFFEAKDHKTVIRALPHLREEIHILFCGYGEQGINECKQLAENLNVDSRVHFLGNRTDVERIIKSSDVGILSSFYEGFGLAILEAMAAGIPAIASDVEGVEEIVKGHGILFPVGDYRQLATEIMHLLENRIYYAEVAQKCYARSLEFGQEQFIEKHLTLYQELCNRI
jgi:glycosyltransferase involved in cell wall biosynthesis